MFPKLGVNYPQSSNASAVTFFSWLLLPSVSQTGGKLPHGGRLTDFYWTICEDTTKWLHFRERGVLGDEPNNFVGFVFHFFSPPGALLRRRVSLLSAVGSVDPRRDAARRRRRHRPLLEAGPVQTGRARGQ